MADPTNNNEIKVMFHAQIESTGNLRCIYNRIKPMGSDRCMTTFMQGTPEFTEAYNAARASGVLVAATELIY